MCQKGNRLLFVFGLLFLLPLLFFFGLYCIRVQDPVGLQGVATSAPYPEIYKKTILADLWNGTYQNEFDKWFKENFAMRNSVIRSYNQVKSSVFHETDSVFINDGYYFNTIAGMEATATSKRFSQDPELEASVTKIRAIQDAVTRRGKRFFVFVAPDKTMVYPEHMPWRFRVLRKDDLTTPPSEYQAVIDAFEKHGVFFYDSYPTILEMKENNEAPVFYKTGHHWNQVSLPQIINEAFRMVEKTQGGSLPEIKLTYAPGESQYGPDKDIYGLANFWFGEKDDVYYVPEFSFENKSQDGLMIFSTSFGADMFQVLNPAPDNRAFQTISRYHYLTGRAVANDERIWWWDGMEEGQDLYFSPIFEDVMNNQVILVEMDAIYGFSKIYNRFIDYLYERLVAPNCELGVSQQFSDPKNAMTMENWYQPEPWGRWSGNREAKVNIRMSQVPAKDLLMHLDMQVFYQEQNLDVFVNGEYITTLRVSTDAKQYDVNVPASLLRNGTELDLTLRLENDALSPKAVGMNEDVRTLGVGLISIMVEEEAQ